MESMKNGDSKDKLNESTLPLLEEGTEKGEGGETPEKEVIELTSTDKDDDSEKKDKEKETKSPKIRRKPPSCNKCLENLTPKLNMTDRDVHNVNYDVYISFEDVIGEPDTTHGVDGIWRLSFLLFSFSKLWIYRLLSFLIALPLALIWGVVFSIVSTFHIWIVTPVLKLVFLVANVIKKIWTAFVDTLVEPLCYACGACLARRTQTTV